MRVHWLVRLVLASHKHFGPQCIASLHQGLHFMVTNIDEEAHGRFHLWGVTANGQSVLVRVNDFRPSFMIAAPTLQVSASQVWTEMWMLLDNGW